MKSPLINSSPDSLNSLNSCPARKKAQQGITLFVSLILLLVMSLLGISSIQVTTMEEKMASNAQDMNIAFEAAETALRLAARDIPNAQNIGFTDICNQGYCTAFSGNNSAARWEDPNLNVWLDRTKNQQLTQQQTGISILASQPQYIIERIQHNSPGDTQSLVIGFQPTEESTKNQYRVTVRATGATDTAVVILQALYSN